MVAAAEGFKVQWYRVPVDRETLRSLTTRSDAKGLLQVVPYLGLLVLTGAAAMLAWGRLPVGIVVAILFLHGTFFAFMINAFHELVHGTVFKTRWLNTLFLGIVSWVSWNNPVLFRASHNRHHWNTLHPPHDLEVVLRIRFTLPQYLLGAVVDPVILWGVLVQNVRLALGMLKPGWESTIFPRDDPRNRARLFWFARSLLIGHAAIVAVSVLGGFWMLAVVTTCARFYGTWLFYLCNNTQHAGLQDNVPDFRLCCRTIELNPFVRFLYFHMNYHTEHHMYAAVPCYNLRRLHQTIRHQMPPTTRGLVATWREIAAIMRRQRREPGYQHVYALPPREPAA
jgi:fatty acid desaturase